MKYQFSSTEIVSESSIVSTIQATKMEKVSFVIFFASSKFDFNLVAAKVQEIYPNTPNIGCVSTGEITTEGYSEGRLAVLAVYSSDFIVEPVILTSLKKKVMLYKRRITRAITQLGLDVNRKESTNQFFMIALTDAFAACEERIGTLLRNIFEDRKINCVGGSAGDLSNGYSYVAINGRVEKEASVILFVRTNKKIMVYNENIYVPKGEMHRVTSADFQSRTISKADNKPFIDLYTQEIGVTRQQLDANIFAKNPIGRVSKGNTYIASPLKVNSDGTITFYTRVLVGHPFYFMEAANLLERPNKRQKLLKVILIK